MIGLITAMPCEAAFFENIMTDKRSVKLGTSTFTRGKIGSTEVVLSVCGVGKVFAGVCANTMIVDLGCTHIVNIGVAGSLDKNIGIGDIVSAKASVQHDMDTSAAGDPVGLISGINVIELPCDEAFHEKFAQYLSANGKALKTGIIATGDQFINDRARKKEIVSRFGACAVEMEGGAIGQICYANSVPYNLIRMMSDSANEDADDTYSLNRDDCAVELAKIFTDFISTLG